MITLKMLSTAEDLLKETGLDTRDALWDAGFDLDDWDVCFVSDVRLVLNSEEPDEDDYYYTEPIDDAYWLVRRMEGYCRGFEETEFEGKWYYMVYHA